MVPRPTHPSSPVSTASSATSPAASARSGPERHWEQERGQRRFRTPHFLHTAITPFSLPASPRTARSAQPDDSKPRTQSRNGVKPVRQPFALAAGEQGSEGPDMAGQSVELGAVTPDGLELELLGFGKGVRVPENPPRDGPGRGRPGDHRPRLRCACLQVGANALLAALVTERHNRVLAVLLLDIPAVRALATTHALKHIAGHAAYEQFHTAWDHSRNALTITAPRPAANNGPRRRLDAGTSGRGPESRTMRPVTARPRSRAGRSARSRPRRPGP